MHRRFGKTVFSLNHMIDRGLRNPLLNPQYAYLAPNYGQAKRVAWEYIKRFTRNIPNVTVNEADLRVDIPRPHMKDFVRIMLLGAENPDSLRGIYLDGVILDEYAQMHPDVWGQVIRPALSDREGWAMFIGTPKGKNHFYDLFERFKNDSDWYCKVYRASETGVIPQKELDSLRREMDAEEFAQEYECSWVSGNVGAYYSKYILNALEQERIGSVPHDPAALVTTFWDLGVGDGTAIWFLQQIGDWFHFIDYEEIVGAGVEAHAKTLREKDYVFEEHVLPHDARQRNIETTRTREQALRNLGIRPTRVLPRLPVDDGIQAVRSILPRCRFDKEKCEKGLDALMAYQREYDNKMQMFKPKPLHNWASHGADAFRYFAVGHRDTRRISHNLPTQAEIDYDVFSI